MPRRAVLQDVVPAGGRWPRYEDACDHASPGRGVRAELWWRWRRVAGVELTGFSGRWLGDPALVLTRSALPVMSPGIADHQTGVVFGCRKGHGGRFRVPKKQPWRLMITESATPRWRSSSCRAGAAGEHLVGEQQAPCDQPGAAGPCSLTWARCAASKVASGRSGRTPLADDGHQQFLGGDELAAITTTRGVEQADGAPPTAATSQPPGPADQAERGGQSPVRQGQRRRGTVDTSVAGAPQVTDQSQPRRRTQHSGVRCRSGTPGAASSEGQGRCMWDDCRRVPRRDPGTPPRRLPGRRRSRCLTLIMSSASVRVG